MLNNISTILNFLKSDGVRLIGIGSEDVLTRNEKLIWGLLWCTILNYHLKGHSVRSVKQELANFVEAVVSTQSTGGTNGEKEYVVMSQTSCAKIQEKVWLRICNTYLQPYGYFLTDESISNGIFDDGVVLHHLVQALSGKDVGKLVEPKTRAHMLNNISTILNFLKSDGVRLIGIGSEDVLTRNEKLIWGLLWCTILNYHLKGHSVRSVKQELANFVEDLGMTNGKILSISNKEGHVYFFLRKTC
eukprot:TRINITY_DN9862_c0_g1_i4.p1 TRINITY_DN9862_c0_g1~~TRINITY_DN9862_c0_g1_i4.p1  ORF type:complete len:245 (-),score=51.58 TRINITY_DN9862_c0_g1_i4:470-1204(-)